jgi:hypothetical protein
MSTEMKSAAIGVGAVLLVYLAYQAMKGGSASGKASIYPSNPGGGWTAVAPGEYLSTDQLIYGAATGSPYDSYATTDQLINGVIYGTNNGSIIKQPGVWW